MRIAFIGQKGFPATYGGVEKVVEKLVSELSARGHTCLVYSRKYYSVSWLPQDRIQRIMVSGLKSKRLDTLSHTFLSVLDACFREVDVVSLHSFGNSIFTVLLRLAGKKVIVHLHGFEWQVKKWNGFDKLLLRIPLVFLRFLPNSITTVSLTQKKELLKRGIPCHYIPNGIAAIQGIPRSHTTTKPYFLFVGRLVFQKGVEYLVKAFNKLSHGSIELLIVGDHNHAESYFETLRSLSRGNDSIKFLGYKYGEELLSLYKGAICVVIPSEVEASPVVLLEALSLGKCILASRIPGITDIAGDIPIYFEPRDDEDLREKLQFVANNPDIVNNREDLARNNPILQEYDWKRIIEKYENLFLSVL